MPQFLRIFPKTFIRKLFFISAKPLRKNQKTNFSAAAAVSFLSATSIIRF